MIPFEGRSLVWRNGLQCKKYTALWEARKIMGRQK